MAQYDYLEKRHAAWEKAADEYAEAHKDDGKYENYDEFFIAGAKWESENRPKKRLTVRDHEIRQQAIIVLELTKGYTPEDRKAMGNLLKGMEDMAGYILELTNNNE